MLKWVLVQWGELSASGCWCRYSNLLQLCKGYSGGWEGLLQSLNASQIQSYEDLLPILTVVEPCQALTLLWQNAEFQDANFGALIEGFLQWTGWPLHIPDNDPLGLASLSSRIGYNDLSTHLNHTGFRSQLLYCCATALDSLLVGQGIRVFTSIFPLY